MKTYHTLRSPDSDVSKEIQEKQHSVWKCYFPCPKALRVVSALECLRPQGVTSWFNSLLAHQSKISSTQTGARGGLWKTLIYHWNRKHTWAHTDTSLSTYHHWSMWLQNRPVLSQKGCPVSFSFREIHIWNELNHWSSKQQSLRLQPGSTYLCL